ncbi:hypothetical protein EV360DRAFT_49937 [Lentinula raphanica]|nr:hypothetical protein EV360DRAFT_49937 [Lentinula raphanica]
MNDPVKRVANALLNRVHSSRPPLLIDLRFPIQTQLQLYADQRTHSGYGGGIFPYLGRPPANIDFAQMACEPPAPHMRFYHPRLPWYIDLMSASYMQRLTVWEVIEGVWRELQKPITSRDFYNEEMGTTARDLVTIAFRSRCKATGETSKGVRRVDWLGMDGEWIWTGIVRNRSGMWEIKTRKI